MKQHGSVPPLKNCLKIFGQIGIVLNNCYLGFPLRTFFGSAVLRVFMHCKFFLPKFFFSAMIIYGIDFQVAFVQNHLKTATALLLIIDTHLTLKLLYEIFNYG